jgi:hypothetical protein
MCIMYLNVCVFVCHQTGPSFIVNHLQWIQRLATFVEKARFECPEFKEFLHYGSNIFNEALNLIPHGVTCSLLGCLYKDISLQLTRNKTQVKYQQHEKIFGSIVKK